jgi:hypothetical protein
LAVAPFAPDGSGGAFHAHHYQSLARGALAVVHGTLRGLLPGDVRDVTNGTVLLELVGADLDMSAMLHLRFFTGKAFLDPWFPTQSKC